MTALTNKWRLRPLEPGDRYTVRLVLPFNAIEDISQEDKL